MKAARGRTSRLITIEAEKLAVHPTAQRDIKPAKLKELRANLDLDAIGVLHAVEYEINGVTKLWIIDGQHRWQALMDHGLGEWLVEVKVHTDVKDDARASELFLRLNARAAVAPFDKFDNGRKAGHEAEVGVTKIAGAHSLTVSKNAGDGKLRCVTALLKTFGIDKGITLTATLDTILGAWGRACAGLEGQLVEGLGIVYKTYNGQIDRPALVKKLSKYPGGPSALIGDARGLRQYRHASVPRCVAVQVVEVYNASRKTGRLEPL